jgi:hypothetical protein
MLLAVLPSSQKNIFDDAQCMPLLPLVAIVLKKFFDFTLNVMALHPVIVVKNNLHNSILLGRRISGGGGGGRVVVAAALVVVGVGGCSDRGRRCFWCNNRR